MKRAIFITLSLFFTGNIFSQTCGNNNCEPGEDCIRDCLLDTVMLSMPEGGRVDWCVDGTIAFDKQGGDGFYDVYTVSGNGSDQKCLTRGVGLPQKHNGQPAWHPSGNWVVFQSEKEEHKGGSQFSTPGRGVYCDLWLTDRNGYRFYKLTDLPADPNQGVLHAHFSYDGKKLSWSQMYKKADLKSKGDAMGCWKLMVADFGFDEKNAPCLRNVKEYIPGDSVFYENHGFSPDGRYLLFTSNFDKHVSPLGGNKLYRLDLSTGKAELLAGEGYNEHACYSPDGKYIVWGSNRENKNRGMDYWIMKADGSDKQRLTYFNQPGYMESSRKRLLAVDMSFSADGKELLAYVQDKVMKDAGRIYVLKFKKGL
ncbi:MAG TPA: hypothetical protein VI112_10610 [Bacteroidia bacterium]|jgi:Tol biopolymer transport system component